jgi:hypothetical protein
MNYQPRGFIALMSAIIISAILLILVSTGSLTGFYGRMNVLDSELKSRSMTAAEACADHAFLLVMRDSDYTGTEVLKFNSLDSCRILVSGTSPKSIRIQATSTPAVTNLLISYDPASYSVLSWREIPIF